MLGIPPGPAAVPESRVFHSNPPDMRRLIRAYHLLESRPS
jgi:hypothetical protein